MAHATEFRKELEPVGESAGTGWVRVKELPSKVQAPSLVPDDVSRSPTIRHEVVEVQETPRKSLIPCETKTSAFATFDGFEMIRAIPRSPGSPPATRSWAVKLPSARDDPTARHQSTCGHEMELSSDDWGRFDVPTFIGVQFPFVVIEDACR